MLVALLLLLLLLRDRLILIRYKGRSPLSRTDRN